MMVRSVLAPTPVERREQTQEWAKENHTAAVNPKGRSGARPDLQSCPGSGLDAGPPSVQGCGPTWEGQLSSAEAIAVTASVTIIVFCRPGTIVGAEYVAVNGVR